MTLDEALALLADREAQLVDREALIAQLQERIEALEVQVGQSSQNSSKPPSSDPPWVKRKPKPRRNRGKRRKRGAQKGHKGHHRALLPADEVDAVRELWPAQCKCGRTLVRQACCAPWRHQVTDIVDYEKVVTEYRRHRVRCHGCGRTRRARLPAGVPRVAFGPGVDAHLSLLVGRFRHSRRMTVESMQTLRGITLSVGAVAASERRMAAALAKPTEEVRSALERAEVLHSDETGWREGLDRFWLWVQSNTSLCVYAITPKRNREVFEQLIGAFDGLLVADDHSLYAGWPLLNRQTCLAHRDRKFEALAELPSKHPLHDIGVKLCEAFDTMFSWWHRVRDGTLCRERFREKMAPLIKRVRKLFERGSRHRYKRRFKLWLDRFDALWTFVREPGVEPTNNLAERDLRHAVIWRKLSFGTQSECGRQFVERMLTTVGTLRKQGRDVLAWLTEAAQAHRMGEAAPSLLPA